MKDGKQRGVGHDDHFDFEVNKILKSGKQKEKRRKHKGLKRKKSVRGKKGKKHGGGNSNEQEEVIYTLVLTNVSSLLLNDSIGGVSNS